jgi:hypothetical protein
MRPVPSRFRLRKQIPRFFRQFLPEDPKQLVFLFSAIFLSGSYSQRWWNIACGTDRAAARAAVRLTYTELLTTLLVLFAGGAAYALCFWIEGEDLRRRWRSYVLVPAVLGMALTVGAVSVFSLLTKRSVLERGDFLPSRESWRGLAGLLVHPGMGFQLAVVGAMLAAVGGWFLRRGSTTLPLRPAECMRTGSAEERCELPRPLRIFAWYVIVLHGLVGGLVSLPLYLLLQQASVRFPTQHLWQSYGAWLMAWQSVPYALALVGMALWSLGDDRRRAFHSAWKVPSSWLLALGAALPLAVYWLPHLALYAVDRIAWAQHWGASAHVPAIERYLRIPPLSLPMILYGAAAALGEFAWRGCVQPAFVRRFGVARGFVFVGLLSGMTLGLFLDVPLGGIPGFLIRFALRLSCGVVLSIVLGWLTLRARSVWPAAACAAVSRILIEASLIDSRELMPRAYLLPTLLAVWAIAALVLVRYLRFDAEGPQDGARTSSLVDRTAIAADEV